ncbi:alpha-amylase family glycosyl hydrolase [Anaerophaga thermohalophila]|uniref:alpha-amylase family glycosyl hydrolase n=1 Tax=Anaerophaga thermohalophila TaxID=177400 RepID=UPI0002F2FCE4|nr:alpha-amylase family glycosyl hydrolase [Anaerophaga thermohalophila]
MNSLSKKFFITLTLLIFFFSSTQLFSQVFSRTDFRDETIYFVITTRFYDGDPTNNVHCWDGKSLNQGDPAWRGDFKGLIEKLDYIKALGFTSVWITPVVENASGYDYHGYHAMNFNKVDPRYESVDVSFQELIDEVHNRDMKIILDVVFNHSGNFGEAYLCPMFEKDYTADLADPDACLVKIPGKLPVNYDNLTPGEQYQARLALMKNTDGQNHDSDNHYHHFGNFNWDDITCQWAQIAGDCVDLNTENPIVYNYLIQAYSQFIQMGVDGFRIDTGRHISRLVFNKVFNPAFKAAAEAVGNNNFFMFSEICTRDRNYWYRGTPAMSTPFYTWKDSKTYNWSNDPSEYINVYVPPGEFPFLNQQSCITNYNDNTNTGTQPVSNNAFLNGNEYHTPDHSMHSGLNVIDFPMHWNFENAYSAFGVATSGDHTYNDPTFNVVYVDSHDYAPDQAPEDQRFAKPQSTWAENLTLMYTFRGIPCLYYGSEIEFKKGMPIDKGPTIPLKESGRAYYGGYISGDVTTTNFAEYTNASGNVAVTLEHPLAKHIQRLSKIRMAIPALRKGQYSTENISSSGIAFKRRYTDSSTDSYVLVAISGNATFSNILNGTYTDVVTGDVKTVSSNTLSVSVSGQGNLRAYVLDTPQTQAPGKIGEDGKYLYSSTPVETNPGPYPDETEPLLPSSEIPEVPVEPVLYENEQAIFFEAPEYWGDNVNTYIYYDNNGSVVMITSAWPGDEMTNLGNNIYKYTFEGTINNWKVLFNDGSNQAPSSIGFDVINGGYYTSSGLDHTLSPIPSAINKISANELMFFSSHGILYAKSSIEAELPVYSVSGKMIKTIHIRPGHNAFYGIPNGICIINRQKVLVHW